MSLVLPREEEVENMFSRILSSDQYCERLMDAFYDHLCDDKRTRTRIPIILQKSCWALTKTVMSVPYCWNCLTAACLTF